MVLKSFADFGIEVPADATGNVKTTCPQCSPSRKKSTDPCLSVNVDEGVWNCWHCGWTGGLKVASEKKEPTPKRPVRPAYKASVDLPEKVLAYFAGRGITPEALKANRVGYGMAWMPGADGEVTCIQFPYVKGGEVVNIKFRDGKKRFRQAKDAEKCLYRFDEIASRASADRFLVITEGEMDALSLVSIGINAVTSVPDGAPSPGTKQYEKKFSFLEPAEEILAAYGRVILCVDNDLPGQTLERELARRIGVEKCWRVTYPDGCKDINEVLVKHGKDAAAAVIANAVPMPVVGLFGIPDLAGDVGLLYAEGMRPGVSTGWACLDEFYTVRPGEMTIVTGIPGSGKSNWLDALLVNLHRDQEWAFALFSPENWPPERHVANILEKIIRKPFSTKYSHTERMREDEVASGMQYMDGFFHFIMPPEDEMSLDSILQKARAAIYRFGCRGVVIDPWNEIEHNRGDKMSETDYISQCLTKIRRFARMNNVHVWLVAHPTKLQKNKDSGDYPVPTMYDISGSAHWRNKADNGICVHRPDIERDVTEVYIQKIRFREIGKLGKVELKYARECGIYFE